MSLLRGLSHVVNYFSLAGFPSSPESSSAKCRCILKETRIIKISTYRNDQYCVYCSCQLFAYSVLPCRFVYICRAGEKIIILRFSFSGLFLEIIWLLFGFILIWYMYLAANLPQEKSYRCNRNFGLFFVFVLITQFAFLSLCKSILAFRRATQII